MRPDKAEGRRLGNAGPSKNLTRQDDGGFSITRTTWTVADLPENIARRITVDPVSGCWLIGPNDRHATIGGRSAHRLVYELLVGPVPRELVVDHREDWGCRSKACCFPGHLKPATVRTNSTRPGARGVAAVNAAKFECDHGHRFDLITTYVKPDGHRDCRVCIRRRVAEYRRRLRAKRAGAREIVARAA